MPADLYQYARWHDRVGAAGSAPLAVESATYTCSHGVRPGTAVVVTVPQPDPLTGRPLNPAVGQEGDLVFGDGHREVRLRRCRITRVLGRRDTSSGVSHTFEVADRRWRWVGPVHGQEFGQVTGRFNRQDPRGKLVPWSIRSPRELAEICLRALGETAYAVALPDGLPASAGADLTRYLLLGENFPRSVTNLPVEWDHAGPAGCLARLADALGCRVVYQPAADRVLVAPLGVGVPLPDHPYESVTPSVQAPEVPARVVVVSAPVRWQCRFLLSAVAKEAYAESGMYVPVGQASYGPLGAGAPQVATVTPSPVGGWPGVEVRIGWADPATGEGRTAYARSADTGRTVTQHFAALAGEFAAQPEAAAAVTAAAAGEVLTLTGRTDGLAFDISAVPLGLEDGDNPRAYRATVTQAPRAPGVSWAFCPPPHYHGVRPTAGVPYQVAVGLARESVWRTYRVMLVDPDGGVLRSLPVVGPIPKPLVVPGFGPVTRLQQIQLLPTKVTQVTPRARVAGGVDRGNIVPGSDPFAQGILPADFYTGASQDQAAAVYGSVYRYLDGGRVLWTPGGDWNTPAGSPVYTPFQVTTSARGDPLVVFSAPVYEWDAGGLSTGSGFVKEPRLTLETACVLLDADTDMPRRWSKALELGGTGPPEYHVHDDIAVGVLTSDMGNAGGTVGTVTVRWTRASTADAYPLQVSIGWTKGGQGYTAYLQSSEPGLDLATRWANLRAAGANHVDAARDLDLSFDGKTFRVTGKSPFRLVVTVSTSFISWPGPGAQPPDWSTAYAVTPAAGAGDETPVNPIPAGQFRYAPGDLEHATAAADYYLVQHAKKYRLTAGEVRDYVGIYPIDPDGYVQQVTWSIGDGATTTASANCEHSTVVLGYPARRRVEDMPPERSAALANLTARRQIEAITPRPGGAVR